MAQEIHAQWIAVENIARFEHQLKSETDFGRREMLEGLLVQEREKLKAATAERRE